MRLALVFQISIICCGTTMNAERLTIPPAYSFGYNSYEQVDTLMQRVDGSGATAPAKELYKFAILNAVRILGKEATLEDSLEELANTMEESIVALAMSTETENIAAVIKGYYDFACISSLFQASMKKYETRFFRPVNWVFLQPCKLLLQRYISYLDRMLRCRRAAFLIDGVRQIDHFSHTLRRAKVLIMAAHTVLVSIEQVGVANVLRKNGLQYSKSSPHYGDGVQIGELLANKIATKEYTSLELAFGATYCLLSVVGSCVIIPIMCTTPALMLTQCMWMVFSFTGLHLIVIAAYISFLE